MRSPARRGLLVYRGPLLGTSAGRTGHYLSSAQIPSLNGRQLSLGFPRRSRRKLSAAFSGHWADKAGREDVTADKSTFKDGASKAPTTLTQITDAFKAMWDTYEGLWKSGKCTALAREV